MMPDDLHGFLVELSAELDRARQAAGLNQSQLARRADMPISTVNQILGARHPPALTSLVKIARAAGCSLVITLEREP